MPSFRWSSQPEDGTQVSCIAGGFFYCLSHQGSPWLLVWVAYLFSMGSSGPRNRLGVSCTAGRFFTSSATREVYLFHNMLSQISLEFKALPRDVGDTIQKHRTTVVQAWLCLTELHRKQYAQCWMLKGHLKNSRVFISHLERDMATLSSILAWKIPWTEETGRV